MNGILLDPWVHAEAISTRLKVPFARLVLIIGAESWCETCRTLRPVFESLAAQRTSENEVWLWLDLEDHAEFLDGFIPDSLPFLVSYKDDSLTHVLVPSDLTAPALTELLSQPLAVEQHGLPNIRARLMVVDWAL